MKKEKTSKEEPVSVLIVDETKEETEGALEENKKSYFSVFQTYSSARFGIVTLILSLIGIGISIDSLIKIREWSSGLQTVKDQIEKHLNIEQQRLDNLEHALQEIDGRQKAVDQQLSQFKAHYISASGSPVDVLWQLQKAYNWLEEAKLDLNWSGDWQGAGLLLQSVNDVLTQLKIASLQPVQAILSEDIAALSALQPVNEVILLDQIKSLSNSVLTLPAPMSSQTTEPATSSSDNVPTSRWRAALNKGLAWVQKVVVVKPADSAQSMPQAQSRRILNENLIVSLQQAQWALLKKDNVLFHWNLDQIVQMTQNNAIFIDLQDPKTLAFVQTLNELAKQNLAPTLPDIQPVCQQLKVYMDTLRVPAEKTT